MTSDREQSIILINNEDSEGSSDFGTGFVVNQGGRGSYVATCAHVTMGLKGSPPWTVGNHKTVPIAEGEHNGLDLTILHIEDLFDRPRLELQSSVNATHPIIVPGFRKERGYIFLKELRGQFEGRFSIYSPLFSKYVRAFEIQLEEAEDTIQEGYSGSPVIDTETQCVIGVVFAAKGKHKGLAIWIGELFDLWPELPPELFADESDKSLEESISKEIERWEKYSLWKMPYYPFRIPYGYDEHDRQQLAEVYIDVTSSAPSFADPGKTLCRLFDEVLKLLPADSDPQILDFGAGKLRNAIYFLERGYSVYAVEYEKLKQSKQAQRLLKKALQHEDRFREYIFPDEFVASEKTFDLILLINVLTIMPVPAERWLLLLHCHEKLKQDGYLLWYTMFGDKDQRSRLKDDNRIGDGWFIGKNRKLKTFYREFNTSEIDDMLLACGFKLEKTFGRPHRIWNNQARLYRKHRTPLLRPYLTRELIEKSNTIDIGMAYPSKTDPTIVVPGASFPDDADSKYRVYTPNPDNLLFESLLLRCLESLHTTPNDSEDYGIIVQLLVSRIFENSLYNRSILEYSDEAEHVEKRTRFVMRIEAARGFFYQLKSDPLLSSNYVMFECLNDELSATDTILQDIVDRLQQDYLKVCIVFCRSVSERTTLLARQRSLYPNYLIVILDDQDLIELTNLHLYEDRNAVTDFFDNKSREVMFGA